MNTEPTSRVTVDVPDDLTLRIGAGAVLGQPWGDLWLDTPHPDLNGIPPRVAAERGQHQAVAGILVSVHRRGSQAVAHEIVRARNHAVKFQPNTELPTLDWLHT